MVKSTKLVRAISSIITFQKRIPQGIQSVTIKGKESLADLDLDKNYDMDLKLNADKDKLNNVSSSVPFIQATTSTSGSVPDEQKSVNLAQDLREFPLTSGELVTVEKTENTLTINDRKVKELVESKAEALKKELGAGTSTPASTLTLNGGELVKVDKSGDTLTLNDGKVKELVDTKTNQVKTELIGMLPQKVIIEKVDDINNAILQLPIRPDDTVAYITIICINTDNTESVVTLSVPTGVYEFKNVEHGIYTFYGISRENILLNMYFKKTVSNLIVKMLVFGDIYQEPTIDLNTLEGTYDTHITTGNTSQPLHYDEL
jgi:hypothetical protein|nr:MAG TPA: hypothetical protein [Caudoviricetes sp.]